MTLTTYDDRTIWIIHEKRLLCKQKIKLIKEDKIRALDEEFNIRKNNIKNSVVGLDYMPKKSVYRILLQDNVLLYKIFNNFYSNCNKGYLNELTLKELDFAETWVNILIKKYHEGLINKKMLMELISRLWPNLIELKKCWDYFDCPIIKTYNLEELHQLLEFYEKTSISTPKELIDAQNNIKNAEANGRTLQLVQNIKTF